MPIPKAQRPSPDGTAGSEIAPGVFVGGRADATRFRGVRISVRDLDLSDEVPAEHHLPIYDGATDAPLRANLDRVAAWVEAARARGAPVLIFCGHGERRGPLAGAWYLHLHDRIPLGAAYARIRAVRPQVAGVEEWIGHPEVLSDDRR